MKKITRAQLTALSGAAMAIAGVAYSQLMLRTEAYRRAIDFAGDDKLPGACCLPREEITEKLASLPDVAGRAAYLEVLRFNDWLALLIWLSLSAVALLAFQKLPSRWSFTLFASSTLAAGSYWTENYLLRQVFAPGAAVDATAIGLASTATTAKWILLASSIGFAIAVLLRIMGPVRAWTKALFLEVPYLIDSAWRKIDCSFHCEFRYHPAGEKASVSPRPCWQKPPFLFYCLTVVFVSFGPTVDGLCTVVRTKGALWLLGIGGALLFIAAVVAWHEMKKGIDDRIVRRFARLVKRPADEQGGFLPERQRIARMVMYAIEGLLLVLVVAAGLALFYSMGRNPCSGAEFSVLSAARLLLCVVAIGVYAVVSSKPVGTAKLLWIQALILGAVSAIQWYGLAPSPAATEASGLPYRHVFGVFVPAICLALCVAPAAARARFRPWPWFARWFHRKGLSDDIRKRFAERLPEVELFDPERSDPELTPGRVVQAFVRGVFYRPLQLLLPPGLLGLVAPADWLFAGVALGLVFSLLFLTWGSISTRWQQMVLLVERWLLSGIALPVSIFVVMIAALRVLGVQYVSTILDAAPFGAIFSGVVMSYVLSWLVEYWINRAVAVELLGVLGAPTGAGGMAYSFNRTPEDTVRVEQRGRYLMSHGIGRLLVVGTRRSEPTGGSAPTPPHATAPSPGKTSDAELRFHSYSLLEVFERLATEEDQDRLTEVTRYTDLYFYAMNFVLILVVGVFVGLYLWPRGGESEAAVVEARSSVVAEKLSDLSKRLVLDGANARPVVVVVASGGGTRAALYTAHVLQGLHKIGVDRDIALLSGVSGGGVALAYFAANYDALIEDQAPKLAAWDKFTDAVSSTFIQDVIEGASEWRIFGGTPLTYLLAESFDRRLFKDVPNPQRFGQIDPASGPALILNTTIAGHPLEDSDVLRMVLNGSDRHSDAECLEAQRAYNLMNGGRLIFTNLKDLDGFPPGKSIIPDTRLPYQVLRDPAVPLAWAAALTANFSPAFQNARVLVKGYAEGQECPDRSYFVTDGGAQENLGLISALFAIESALRRLVDECKNATPSQGPAGKCVTALRPIHFVMAEASVADYDYQQDRGVSAAFSGAKERMAGGLTNELIDKIGRLYSEVSGESSGEALHFHYLPLPLAFRARGGFGTHWMHADRVELTDPRLRAAPTLFDRLFTRATNTSVGLNKSDLRELWTALHDPNTPFCEHSRFENIDSETVRRWICGARNDSHRPRDLHVEAWQSLVAELRVAGSRN